MRKPLIFYIKEKNINKSRTEGVIAKGTYSTTGKGWYYEGQIVRIILMKIGGSEGLGRATITKILAKSKRARCALIFFRLNKVKPVHI